MVIPCWYLPRLLSNPASRNSPRCSQATLVPRGEQDGSVGVPRSTDLRADGRPQLVEQATLDPLQGTLDVDIGQRALRGPQHQPDSERFLARSCLWTAIHVGERDRLDRCLTGGPDRFQDGRVRRRLVENDPEIAYRGRVTGRWRDLRR